MNDVHLLDPLNVNHSEYKYFYIVTRSYWKMTSISCILCPNKAQKQ
jgi:hypothetical protein